MRTRQWLVYSIGCLGCAHAPVDRSPALAKVEFYVGRWQCAGLEYDAQGAVTKTYPKLEIRVAPAFANWLRVEVFDGGEQITSELKGVDSKGVWHHMWVANDGASGSLTSPGWSGDQLVFEEDQAEVDRGSGFKLEFEKTCHKT